jgi:vacuolar-type H+-ATPase subunit F/Vma7
MSRAVAIGDRRRLAGYALAGALAVSADSPQAIEAAWERLGEDATLLVLTPEARAQLEARLASREDLIWVVLPS